jgi:hypothetical protein
MKKETLVWIFVAVTVAAALTSFARWRANAREAALQSRLREQLNLLADAKDRNARLRQAMANRAAQDDREKRELLRFRGEVSQLRRAAVDPKLIETKVEELKAEAIAAQNRSSENLPPRPDLQKVQAFWPRDQLAFAGHSDQRSAIQSTLWAMSVGDQRSLELVMSPGAAKTLNEENRSPNPLRRQSNLIRLADSLRPAAGFYLVSDDLAPRMLGIDQKLHLFKVYFEGEGGTRAIGLAQVGEEWKFNGVYSISGTDEKPICEMNLWP